MFDRQEQLRDTAPPVAVIGASAGGLEPLLELLSHLPEDAGFAILVLLHSAPDHEPLLADILAGRTSLPVSEAGEGDRIEADHVYVTPPRLGLDWSGECLVFAAPANPEPTRKPIDHLLLSLAHHLEGRAVAVVLSGTGSDGTEGIKAIKSRGGIAMIQDPDSALFDTMPRSALGLGCVDFVLPPEGIARELARLGREPPLAGAGGPRPPCIGEDDLAKLFQMLKAACGIDFSPYKRSTIRRRLLRRLALHKQHSIADYFALLDDQPAEAMALCQDFLIRVTGFFREPEMFMSLTEEVFPRLLQNRSGVEPLRIWVPGCSTGEEVYSIAIALWEFLGASAPGIPIQLFGTDISGEAINRARAGLYPAKIQQQVSPERLQRFFDRAEGQFQIRPAIRDLCVFALHDLARDPPFSRLDLISCCNLLIYFDLALQKRVVATFHYALKPGGCLVLGPSESIGQYCAKYFSQIDKQRKIYIRKNEPGRLVLDLNHISENLMSFDPVKAAPEEMRPPNADGMQSEIERLIVSRYAPAGLVIDEFQNVLHFTGRVAPFLELRSGPAVLSLRRLVRPALQMAIMSAVSEARAVNGPVRRERLRVESDGGERVINLDLAPLKAAGEAGYYLVTFEELSRAGEEGAPKSWLAGLVSGWLRARETGGDEPSPRLKQDLDLAQDQLRATLEAYDNSREELKSVQDELLSVREEFQSTNEELETAKEELQAANEELITANEELRIRNAELNRAMGEVQSARDYAQAIVDSTPAALLVLDRELRVQRCNQAFSEVFRLPCEIAEGRLLGDLGGGTWNRSGLLEPLKGVAANGTRIENLEIALEFSGLGKRVLVFNARKLIGEAELSELVLLSMLDVTAQRSAENRIRQQAELLDQAHEAILIWTLGDGIRYWNRGAEELYGWTRDEALGRVSHDLLKTRRDIGSEEFDRKLYEERQWIGEVCHTTRDGRELIVDSRYSVHEQADGSLLVLETNRDITERKQAERSLRRADRQKDEFLAMLAHELRNPLAPLRNALGIMQRANPNDVPSEEIRGMMDRQVTKLTRIVDDLLDIARVTRGQIELRREIVDLVDLVGHSVESIRPQLKACGHRLAVSSPRRPVRIDADPVRIGQIIENLLSNSVKYTPAGGLIEVMLETLDDEAVLRIKDNGQGISAEALPSIFELFMQADRSLDRKQGGLGIGLTLVRRLAELHGGRVDAESDGPGCGSRFTVRLPLAEPTGALKAAPSDAGATDSSPAVRRVLVVDDNSDATDSTAMLVRATGREVRLAYDAATALEIAARFKPDVVLLDIGLPDMDGYRLARHLRALDGLERVYLVAVSGYGSPADRAASREAGIDRHLVKPVDLAALEAVLGSPGTGEQ